jgi:phosphohistidine phosphatase
MELYFLRHGKAQELGDAGVTDDFGRALTEKGIAEMEAEAKAMDRIGIPLDVILTSPLVRAKETAAIVARRLGLKDQLFETELLTPGCSVSRLQKLIAEYPKAETVMLVGHEPDLSTIVGELIGGARIEMKKGGFAAVICNRLLTRGCGTLKWLAPPKILIG